MTPITACRLSGSTNLIPILDLGNQAMTGRFPRPGEGVERGPLELVWCPDSGLLQLGHTFDPAKLYGDNYGYRSGLNAAMVKHLGFRAASLARYLEPSDLVLDIGSNDGTLLGQFSGETRRVGMDPTISKFRQFYDGTDIVGVPEFFSAETFDRLGFPKPKLITAVAMFYDLDDPVGFLREVESVLAPGGVLHIEVADARVMIASGVYDGIVHEHACYYTFETLLQTLHKAGFQSAHAGMNSVNGGSVWIDAYRATEGGKFGWLDTGSPSTLSDLRQFERRVIRHSEELHRLLTDLRMRGHSIIGYGASTKFNTVLQFMEKTSIYRGRLSAHGCLSAIADVNPDKWGCVTPGTNIPIISEAEMRECQPDYLLVGPWHFRNGIMEREKALHDAGTRFIFHMPEIEII